MIVNIPLPRYSFESTPIWMCAYCGRVETLPPISTYTPSPVCTCMMQAGFVAQKLRNPAAERVMAGLETYWKEKREKADALRRARAQELLNWPPAATPEDWSLRNAENAGR